MHETRVDADDLLTYAEAAALLNVSTRTVMRLRQDGALDPVVDRGLRGAVSVRFRRSDVEALLAGDESAAVSA